MIITFGVYYGGPSGLIDTWKHFAKQRALSLRHYNGVAKFNFDLEGSWSLENRAPRNDAWQGLQEFDMQWLLRIEFDASNKKQLKFLPFTNVDESGGDVGFQIYSIEIER